MIHKIVQHPGAAEHELNQAIERAQACSNEQDVYYAVWQRLSESARMVLAYRALLLLAAEEATV